MKAISTSSLFAITSIVIATICSSASARIINIPDDFRTIQAGIDTAARGDTVLIQPDVYQVNSLNTQGKAIIVTSRYIFTSNRADINNTILDGGGDSRIFVINRNESQDTKIIGFTMRNGFSQAGIGGGGGALYVNNASPVIRNCRFTSNLTASDGGAANLRGISAEMPVQIIDCTFDQNEANFSGGAVTAYNAQFDNCIFESNVGNRIDDGRDFPGAALIANASNITKCLFRFNRIEPSYLGVIVGSATRLDSCDLINNDATALYLLSGTFIARSCRIAHNSSNGTGGAFHVESNNSFIAQDCIITDNEASSGGAGFFTNGRRNLFQRCVIDNNHAEQFGGAFYLTNGLIEFQSCSFWNNFSDQNGSAFLMHDSAFALLQNSIIWNHSMPSVVFSAVQARENLFDATYSDIEGGRDSILTNDRGEIRWRQGNISDDPLFAQPDSGDFALSWQSPCVDAGDPTEQDEDGTRIDMGAVPYAHARIQVSIDTLGFEDVQVGTRDTLTFTVEDSGRGILDFGLRISGNDSSLFAFAIESDSTFRISPDSAIVFAVIFTPNQTGIFRSSLVFNTNDRSHPQLEIPIIGTTSGQTVDGELPPTPVSFALEALYPNPFNSTVHIGINVPFAGFVQIRLLNTSGQEVSVISESWRTSGRHSFTWKPEGLATGLYLLQARYGSETRYAKVTLLK